MEQFVTQVRADPSKLTSETLNELSASIIAKLVPWSDARIMWQARVERVSDWFVKAEAERQKMAKSIDLEILGRAEMAQIGFVLTAKADRIDVDENNAVHIYDYKTGKPPTKKEQLHFEKQLLLEAAIAENLGFKGVSGTNVESAIYIGLGNPPSEVMAPLENEHPSETWAKLIKLVSRYLQDDQGFTSLRAMQKTDHPGNYDQLARFGEWDLMDGAELQDVGK
jgi:RecB family exonuclease